MRAASACGERLAIILTLQGVVKPSDLCPSQTQCRTEEHSITVNTMVRRRRMRSEVLEFDSSIDVVIQSGVVLTLRRMGGPTPQSDARSKQP